MNNNQIEIQIPQHLIHKYVNDYPIPEIICRLENINGNIVLHHPTIIDVEIIIPKLEHSEK